MRPSPTSMVRNLPHHLWCRLPLSPPKRLSQGLGRIDRHLSTSSIGRQSAVEAPASDTAVSSTHIPISASMEGNIQSPPKDEPRASRQNTLMNGTLTAKMTGVKRVKPEHNAKVARLRKSLHRVLFSPGVHFIRDPRTGVQNFEAKLEEIPPPEQFAFHRCPQFLSPSRDASLASLAAKVGCTFVGSTSSLTQALSQIYFALSGGKGINLSTISMEFQKERTDFTAGAHLPASLVLRPLADHPTIYAVDSDKSYDTDNVLSDYGRVLEKVLTSEENDFKRFLNSAPESAVPDKERNEREAYSYCRTGSMLMRSQLDCKDSRLPGSGVFDIKTRACFPIRHDRANYQANSVYDISTERGKGQTFERELYDLARSGMLKYSMQVRIGGMDGVFCAYHNTKRLLGFQYLPLAEMDKKLFGSPVIGKMSFGYCVALLEVAFKYITSQVSGQELSIIVRQSNDKSNSVDIAFFPTSDPTARQGIRLSIQNVIDGETRLGELYFDQPSRPWEEWTANYHIRPLESDNVDKIIASTKKLLGSMAVLSVPEGKTVQEMTTASEAKASANSSSLMQWKNPNRRIKDIREEARLSGKAYEARKLTWRTNEHGERRGRRVKVKVRRSKMQGVTAGISPAKK